MAGTEFGKQPQGESNTSPLRAHEGRVLARTQAIFADYNVYSTLERNDSNLTVIKKDDELRAVLMNKRNGIDDITHDETVILRFTPDEENTSCIELIKGRFDTKIALNYEGIDDEGNASFIDGGSVVYRRGFFGARSFYFPSTGELQFDLGIDLFVEKSEEDKLTVRDDDDPTVQGIEFPLQFNIYERLQHYEDRLRNGGHDGK
jgi:hypothetical protein